MLIPDSLLQVLVWTQVSSVFCWLLVDAIALTARSWYQIMLVLGHAGFIRHRHTYHAGTVVMLAMSDRWWQYQPMVSHVCLMRAGGGDDSCAPCNKWCTQCDVSQVHTLIISVDV